MDNYGPKRLEAGDGVGETDMEYKTRVEKCNARIEALFGSPRPVNASQEKMLEVARILLDEELGCPDPDLDVDRAVFNLLTHYLDEENIHKLQHEFGPERQWWEYRFCFCDKCCEEDRKAGRRYMGGWYLSSKQED